MEDTVLAFSQGIDWENAVLSGPTFDLHSLKLEGTGHIAIATSKALLAIPVKTKDSCSGTLIPSCGLGR